MISHRWLRTVLQRWLGDAKLHAEQKQRYSSILRERTLCQALGAHERPAGVGRRASQNRKGDLGGMSAPSAPRCVVEGLGIRFIRTPSESVIVDIAKDIHNCISLYVRHLPQRIYDLTC